MSDDSAAPAATSAASQNILAVQVARLYYVQGLTTDAIARELGLSRPKVSRLLSHARRSGLVEIRIHDPEGQAQELEARLQARYPLLQAQVVSVPQASAEALWLERTAAAAAAALGRLLRPGMTVGLAWGNTLSAVIRTPIESFAKTMKSERMREGEERVPGVEWTNWRCPGV